MQRNSGNYEYGCVGSGGKLIDASALKIINMLSIDLVGFVF